MNLINLFFVFDGFFLFKNIYILKIKNMVLRLLLYLYDYFVFVCN